MSSPLSSSQGLESSLMLPLSQLANSLKDCKTLEELRRLARENKTQLDGIHDSIICVVCSRLGYFKSEEGLSDESHANSEAIKLYSLAVRNWLNRPFNSPGRDARGCANIMHAGAKLRIDTTSFLYRDLCDAVIIFAGQFNPQGVANCLWAVGTLGVKSAGQALVPVLVSTCMNLVSDFDVLSITNCFLSVAKLGVKQTGSSIVHALITRCKKVIVELDTQDVSNVLWSMATLEISNKDLVYQLSDVCIVRFKELTPQGVSIILWAVSTLGEELVNPDLVPLLLSTSLEQIKLYNTIQLAVLFRAIVNLGVSDSEIVKEVVSVCIFRAHELSPQSASTCLWSSASLGSKITGEEVIPVLVNVCLKHLQAFDDMSIANCLWAIALLDFHNYEKFTSSLQLAVSTRYKLMLSIDEATQCLQAHYSGITLSDAAIKHFHEIRKSKPPQPNLTTQSQLGVALVLKRLGYVPQLEVPLFDGLVTVDIVINLSRKRLTSSDKDVVLATDKKIAIEFDGPKHFMKKAKGSTECAGPKDARTRLRNTLIQKSGEFEALMIIPYYEWDEVWQHRHKLQLRNIQQHKQQTRGNDHAAMVYIRGKIDALLGRGSNV